MNRLTEKTTIGYRVSNEALAHWGHLTLVEQVALLAARLGAYEDAHEEIQRWYLGYVVSKQARHGETAGWEHALCKVMELLDFEEEQNE